MLKTLLPSIRSQLSRVVEQVNGGIAGENSSSNSGKKAGKFGKLAISKKLSSSSKPIEKSNFLTPKTGTAFNLLR